MNLVKKQSLAALAFGLALVAPTPTFAALISGSTLHIDGGGIVGATSITFQCNQSGDPACPLPAGQGDFAIANSTGSFLQYNGTYGKIMNINNLTQPLNAPFSLMNFITFNLNNNITLELTLIPLGTDPNSPTCAGLTNCTPTNPGLVTGTNPQGKSAFNLDQNSAGTVASFGLFGIAHSSDGTTANLAGTFSTTFTGLNPQAALVAALAGSAQTYQSNLNITVVSTPEPASYLLSGLGLIAIGLLRIKKVR